MRKGFTLIEIMVVLAIIGILMGLALTSFMGSRKTARDSRRKADLEQIRSALEMCRSDTRNYPSSLPVPVGDSCERYFSISILADPLFPTYAYRYRRVTASSYNLCAYLETGSGSVTECGGNCGTPVCNYKVTNP